jgi:hypothetical protein
VSSRDATRFIQKSERFAEDLGLPMSSQLQNFAADEKSAKQREDELDSAVDTIFQGNAGSGISKLEDAVLETVFDDVVPRRRRRKDAEIPALDSETPSSDSQAVRADIIQRIIFNVENFGALLQTVIGSNPQEYIKSLHSLNSTELEKTLEVLERTRSVNNIATGFKHTFFMVAQATEVTTGFLGVKANGFTEHLRQEEAQISMIMKELAIDNWNKVKAMDSPTARLGVLFCMTLAQTDASNRFKDMLKARDGNQPPNVQNLGEKYADL